MLFSFGRRAHGVEQASDATPSADTAAAADDSSTGPGWYDSSWDLRRGLIVREGLPADAGLHEWLAHHLHAGGAGAAEF